MSRVTIPSPLYSVSSLPSVTFLHTLNGGVARGSQIKSNPRSCLVDRVLIGWVPRFLDSMTIRFRVVSNQLPITSPVIKGQWRSTGRHRNLFRTSLCLRLQPTTFTRPRVTLPSQDSYTHPVSDIDMYPTSNEEVTGSQDRCVLSRSRWDRSSLYDIRYIHLNLKDHRCKFFHDSLSYLIKSGI